jgi:hypothetical protein
VCRRSTHQQLPGNFATHFYNLVLSDSGLHELSHDAGELHADGSATRARLHDVHYLAGRSTLPFNARHVLGI